MQMSMHALAFAVAAGTGWIAAVGCRALAHRFGIVNNPNPIVPQHRVAIAYLGGVAIFAGMSAGVVAPLLGRPLGLTGFATTGANAGSAFWLGSALFVSFGLLDDVVALSPLRKFAGQVVLAASFVAAGAPANITGTALDYVLSVSWIVVMVNAMNLTDVCDGLVAGLSAVMALGAALIVPDAGVIMLAVSGACVGVLLLNRPPASIFLGDAGAHLLGFVIAAAQLHSVSSGLTAGSAIAFPLLPAVVVFELASLMLIRRRKRIPLWRGSPDHFSLRLQRRGLGRWQVDLISWSIAIACAAAAVVVYRAGNNVAAGAGVAAVIAGIVLFHALDRLDPIVPAAGPEKPKLSRTHSASQRLLESQDRRV